MAHQICVLTAFSEDRLRQSSNVVASVNCLELPADGHFAWDVRWQGTKENFVLYRHDFSRALIQNQNSASQNRISRFKSWTPQYVQKPGSMLHLQPSPNKRTGYSCDSIPFAAMNGRE